MVLNDNQRATKVPAKMAQTLLQGLQAPQQQAAGTFAAAGGGTPTPEAGMKWDSAKADKAARAGTYLRIGRKTVTQRKFNPTAIWKKNRFNKNGVNTGQGLDNVFLPEVVIGAGRFL